MLEEARSQRLSDRANVTEIGRTDAGMTGAAQRLLAGAIPGRGPAPVHLWNPAYCGEIDMRIAADGSWHYNGSPIGRPAMVKLFATILRKDPERYVLVTPVERVGIRVDDAPFLAVELACEPDKQGERLLLRTNLDEIVEVGPAHPLRFETTGDGGLKPYVRIRSDLWALASRALTHELMARGSVEPAALLPGGMPQPCFGLRSGASFFPICAADEIEAQT